MSATTQDSPELSVVARRIRRARRLYALWAQELRQDPAIEPLLRRLRFAVEASRRAMSEMGIVAQCRRCEEQEGGSCCGSGIEKRYDVILLLVNLLLGASLPGRAGRHKSCCFLGQDGCTLAVRHVLCVNYLCTKLRQALSPEQLSVLQRCTGEELDTGFLLCELIKKRLKKSAEKG